MDALTDPVVEDRHIHGEGTPERAWRQAGGLDQLEPVTLAALAPPGARVVVVAPHPDDEVLGCGGLLALLARARREVVIVGVTDGEASHPGSSVWTPPLLARQRRAERRDGLAHLGMPASASLLGVPDGGVATARRAVARSLADLLRPGDVVVTTWRLDGHPDHEATGRAAAEAAAQCGAVSWEMPVWMWHWASPGDPRVPWHRLRRLALDAEARERKVSAISAHVSQLVGTPAEGRAPVLPAWALARVLRPFEVFFEPEAVS